MASLIFPIHLQTLAKPHFILPIRLQTLASFLSALMELQTLETTFVGTIYLQTMAHITLHFSYTIKDFGKQEFHIITLTLTSFYPAYKVKTLAFLPYRVTDCGNPAFFPYRVTNSGIHLFLPYIVINYGTPMHIAP